MSTQAQQTQTSGPSYAAVRSAWDYILALAAKKAAKTAQVKEKVGA